MSRRRKGLRNMWWRSGLIVIIITNDVAAFQLSCVVNYLSNEQQYGATVFMGENGDRVDIFRELVNSSFETSWTTIDRNVNSTAVNIGLPANYVILSGGTRPESIVLQAVQLLSSDVNSWNPSARMIVIIFPLTILGTYGVVSRIITTLWNHMAYDTVIMITSEDDVGQIFTANPFEEGNECGLKAKKLLNLSCGDQRSRGDVWRHPNVYPNCSLRVSRRQTPPFAYNLNRSHMVEVYTEGSWNGIDIQFVRLLRAKKKLHVVWSERPSPETGVTEKDVHEYYGNFTRHGLDLAIGGSVMMSKYMYTVAYLRPYDQHNLLFYVADADLMRGWPILHTMFTTSTWIVLGLAVLLAGLVYSMMTEGRFYINRTRFLTVFAVLVTQNILQPKRWRPRLLLTFLLLPLYHISSLHLTALQSFMLHTPLNKPIVLESQLRAGNLTVYISNANGFFLMEKSNNQHFETYNDTLETRLKNLEEYRNFSILARSLEAKFFITINQLRVHQLREGIGVLPISMAMTKGNVYFTTVDNLVQQCLEVGLFAKWKRDLTVIKVRKNQSAITAGRAALDMVDLECAVLLLMVGYFAATWIFLGEHFLNWWKTSVRRQSKKCIARQMSLKRKFKYYVIQKDHYY